MSWFKRLMESDKQASQGVESEIDDLRVSPLSSINPMSLSERPCKKCGESKPLTRDFFGHTPSGGFRHSCRKCMAAKTALHHKESPELLYARLKKRKDIENVFGSLSAREKNALKSLLMVKQQSSCFYCLTTVMEDCEIEHKIPIIKGGTNETQNLVLACRKCNREKHGKTIEEYRSWLIKRGYQTFF